MKKYKQKYINNNKYKQLLNDNNNFQKIHIMTEPNYTYATFNQIHRKGKTLSNFNINNLESKYSYIPKKIFKPLLENLDDPYKIKLKSINNNNRRKINSFITKNILPSIGFISNSTKFNNLNLNNKYNNKNKNNNAKNFYTNLTTIRNFTKQDLTINNKETEFQENDNDSIENKEEYDNNYNNNKINDENKYKYSLILKSLDNWDKDHCDDYIKKSDLNIYNYLNNYYIKNNLKEDQNNLLFCSNILKVRCNYNNLVEKGKQNNKIFVEMLKLRRKENGTILKNNLYKAKLKFSQLFNKKYSKEFDENLDIDPDTLNLIIQD